MSIHLATAIPVGLAPASPFTARVLKAKARRRVANDNIDLGAAAIERSEKNEVVLRAALRHFADHGLGAAKVARAQAEKAFFSGDRETYDWWVDITRTLDRRVAADVKGQDPTKAK